VTAQKTPMKPAIPCTASLDVSGCFGPPEVQAAPKTGGGGQTHHHQHQKSARAQRSQHASTPGELACVRISHVQGNQKPCQELRRPVRDVPQRADHGWVLASERRVHVNWNSAANEQCGKPGISCNDFHLRWHVPRGQGCDPACAASAWAHRLRALGICGTALCMSLTSPSRRARTSHCPRVSAATASLARGSATDSLGPASHRGATWGRAHETYCRSDDTNGDKEEG
jgi:hypothetical protein